jgi:hypothetical protein
LLCQLPGRKYHRAGADTPDQARDPIRNHHRHSRRRLRAFRLRYTAYVQRQQVRATVWPILEYSTSNEPNIRFIVENKGVGPAIVRRVVVTVDGQPVRLWPDVLQKLLGPGLHKFSESTISRHVLSAGESMNVFTPRDDENQPLSLQTGGPLWSALNEDRARVSIEIC